MSDEAEYGLVMPFVVVASKDGPFEDNAYCAGWECGKLDADLAILRALGAPTCSRMMRTLNIPQVDLIAMQHGFDIVPAEGDDFNLAEEWAHIVFYRHDSLEADD